MLSHLKATGADSQFIEKREKTDDKIFFQTFLDKKSAGYFCQIASQSSHTEQLQFICQGKMLMLIWIVFNED